MSSTKHNIPQNDKSHLNRRQFLWTGAAAFGAAWSASLTQIPALLSPTITQPDPARVALVREGLQPLAVEIEKLQGWYSHFLALAAGPEGQPTARDLLEIWDGFTQGAENMLGIIQDGELEEALAAALVGEEAYQAAIDARWPTGWKHCDSAIDHGFALCEESATTWLTVYVSDHYAAEMKFCSRCRQLWEADLVAAGVPPRILEEKPIIYRVEA